MHKNIQVIKVQSSRAQAMLTDRRILQRMNGQVRVSFDYDIPYIAGYSTNASTIYVDRHFKTKMGTTDILPVILMHEKTEKALIDYYDLKYQAAHHLATYTEHMLAKKLGIDWIEYSKYCTRYAKILSHEHIKKVPADLDLTPYRDEKDYHLFDKLKEREKNG